MKRALAASLGLMSLLICAQADTLVYWNFNSVVPDDNTASGSTAPAFGAGLATAIGEVSTRFYSGDPAEPGDPPDNSGWSTASYPTQGLSNKTAGVQFAADTTGWENITVAWSERHSGSASRFMRLQYSTDGIVFNDADSLTILRQDTFTNFSVTLPVASGTANNPRFAFRVVAEWASTASAGGAAAYLPTTATNTYKTTGTIRWDGVSISGTRIPGGNTAPTLSRVAPQTLRVGQRCAPIALVVTDAEDPPDALELTASSSNAAVVSPGSCVFSGTGSNRTLTFQTGPDPGSAQVTIQVTDTAGRWARTSFAVTTLALNTIPWITTPLPTNALSGQLTGPVCFSVGDLETPASSLQVSAHSATPTLLADAAFQLAANGSNRFLTLTPPAGAAGVATVQLTVSDGTNSASTRFPVVVTPSVALALYEPFAYPNGPVTTNSAFLWAARSGTPGDATVQAGRLLVDAACSEDIYANLPAGPWETNHGTVLYAAFKARFLSLPKATPEFFAHFGNSSAFRGRVYAGTKEAAPNCFRLFVANGSDTNTPASVSLATNTTFTVVTRYRIDDATTTLWVNPGAETDPGVQAIDPQRPVRISSYCFRQAAELGAVVEITELRVGHTFAAVLPGDPVVTAIPLHAAVLGGNLVLTWQNAAFSLESSAAPSGGFVRLPAAVSPYTNDLTEPCRFFRLKYP